MRKKRNKKCEIESDTNLEMPKVSQDLLGFGILNFEPESKVCQKFTEFILFGKVTSCGKNAGLFQKVTQCYVIYAVEFELRCLIGLPFLQKLTDLKILKWKHVAWNAWSNFLNGGNYSNRAIEG